MSEKIKDFSKWKSHHNKDYGKLKKRSDWIYERTVKTEEELNNSIFRSSQDSKEGNWRDRVQIKGLDKNRKYPSLQNLVDREKSPQKKLGI